MGHPGESLESSIEARWQEWSRRFAALRPREKIMVAAALAVTVLFGGHSLWIEPAMLQTERLKKTLIQQETEQIQLQEQVAALAARDGDPDSANRAALHQLSEDIAAAEREIGVFGNTLVPPQRMPALLQTLLARHRGLTLVSLTTLPPQPLIGLPASEGVTETAGNLYQHGIEIRLAGGYQDLLAYVAELEASPQKLLRGGMRLEVKQHPISELTLTIYTLSLDSTWLVV